MKWMSSEDTQSKQKKEKPERLHASKSEWVLLSLIFLITGLVSFAYVRNQLEAGDRYQGSDIIYVTPVPEDDSSQNI